MHMSTSSAWPVSRGPSSCGFGVDGNGCRRVDMGPLCFAGADKGTEPAERPSASVFGGVSIPWNPILSFMEILSFFWVIWTREQRVVISFRICRADQPLLLHLFLNKLLDSLALRSQPSIGAELEDLGAFLRLEVVRSRPEAGVPSAANFNGPVKVNDLHRALYDVSPVLDPAQIVLQSLALQNVCEISARGKDVEGALHAAPVAPPRS